MAGVVAEIEALDRWVPVRAVPLLRVGRVAAYPGFHGDLVGGAIALPFAAGVLTNPLDAALGDVLVVVVVYDPAGHRTILGGRIRRHGDRPAAGRRAVIHPAG